MDLKSAMKLLLAIAAPLFVLDQWSKQWVVNHLPPYGEPWSIIDGFFSLCHWENTGAAFSIGSGNNWFFVGLSAVTLVGLLVGYFCGYFSDLLSRIGVGLLVAGIMGNLTDRLRFHHVVDFLLVDLHVRFADPWPAFNVADSAIFMATGCFLFSSIWAGQKTIKPLKG